MSPNSSPFGALAGLKVVDLARVLGGPLWVHYDVPYHQHFFTPATLRTLCEKAGLEVLRIGSHGVRFRPHGAPKLRGWRRWAEELRKLPGIGPYTAGAVMAFAFNKAVPIIETNIRKIMKFDQKMKEKERLTN